MRGQGAAVGDNGGRSGEQWRPCRCGGFATRTSPSRNPTKSCGLCTMRTGPVARLADAGCPTITPSPTSRSPRASCAARSITSPISRTGRPRVNGVGRGWCNGTHDRGPAGPLSGVDDAGRVLGPAEPGVSRGGCTGGRRSDGVRRKCGGICGAGDGRDGVRRCLPWSESWRGDSNP